MVFLGALSGAEVPFYLPSPLAASTPLSGLMILSTNKGKKSLLLPHG